jgi:hypothetical protein
MSKDSKALRELIAHIERAGEILQGRLELFHSRFSQGLPTEVGEAFADVAYDAKFLINAVSQLSPLVENDTS